MTTNPISVILIVLFVVILISLNVFILYKISKIKPKSRFWKFWGPLILSFFVILLLFGVVFQKHIFGKSKMEKKLVQHELVLNEKFVVSSNRSSCFGNPFYQFEIQISEKDKKEVINKFHLKDNLIESPGEMYDIRVGKAINIDTVYTVWFEDERQLEYQCFETNSNGKRPKWVVINLLKKQSHLSYMEKWE